MRSTPNAEWKLILVRRLALLAAHEFHRTRHSFTNPPHPKGDDTAPLQD